MGEGWIDPNDGDPKKNYPREITVYVLITYIVAAMGGLIFGYDIGISGGVTSMAPFLQKFFPSVYQSKDEKMKLSDQKQCEDIRSDARVENKALSTEQ